MTDTFFFSFVLREEETKLFVSHNKNPISSLHMCNMLHVAVPAAEAVTDRLIWRDCLSDG